MARGRRTAVTDAHPFSWSVGMAQAADGDTVDSLVSRADADLYEHKRTRQGR